MTRNQLPEGVGKKIVEALKRQAEADITPLEESNNVISNALPLTDIEDVPEIQYETVKEDTTALNDNFIIEEEIPPVMPMGAFQQEEVIPAQPVIKEQPVIQEQPVIREIPSPAPKPAPAVQNIQSFNFNEQPAVKKEKTPKFSSSIQVKIPPNVAVLKNLIATLPVGVSKQTGAQIIRQTLEAMGLPMNSVLKEAQNVQEELNSSTRECMLKIQEYKTNILQLEQSVQEYQKNITQINDLVSLFLLTDKD